MAATFDKIHQPRVEDGKWSRPPEYKPEAPPSEAPELDAQEQEQQASEIQPPPNWKSRGDIWSKLPAEAKALVVQREQDFQRGVSQLGEQAKTARELGQVFEEFRDHLPKTQSGETIPQRDTVRLLLAAHRALEQSPREALAYLAQSYGVSDLGGQQPADVEQIRQQAYAEAQQHLQQHYQAQQQQQAQQQWQQQAHQLAEHVNRFASDKPHWAELEGEILHHVNGLRATNPEMDPREVLRTAYDKALRSESAIRQQQKGRGQETRGRSETPRIDECQKRWLPSFRATKGDVYAGMADVYDRLHGHSGRY